MQKKSIISFSCLAPYFNPATKIPAETIFTEDLTLKTKFKNIAIN